MKPLPWTAAVGLAAVLLFSPPSCGQAPQNKLLTADMAISSPFQPMYSSNTQPQSSAEALAEGCGLDKFAARCGTDGSGVRVAIIDSGLDPGHSDFQGADKISQYVDFTEEGRLKLSPTSYHQQKISMGRRIYTVGELSNALPQYRVAELKVGNLLPADDGEETLDVLAVAQTEAGYDTIYIDTDHDHDFTDEEPLGLYGATGDYLSLQVQGKTYHILLSDIAADGSSLQLSGDFLGHGTFMASIIGADSETYQGLAPKSELYIYKIFDHRGVSQQQGLAQAIRTALADGVDIINLSLSLPADEQVEPALLAAIGSARAAGVPIVAAAGNYGSSLGSLAFPANQYGLISAGSYMAPVMQEQDLGLYLEEGFIPVYSARGDSRIQPTVVAPGAAVAAVPSFFGEDYMYDEGTSAAAAVTTACLTHMQQYVRQSGQAPLNGQQLQLILSLTAKDLGYPNTDQGYGLLDMSNAQRVLDAQMRRTARSLRVQSLSEQREKATTFQIINDDQSSHRVNWYTNAWWLSCQAAQIASGQSLQISPQLSGSLPPGHYSTWLWGIVDNDSAPTLAVPINYIAPYTAQDLAEGALPAELSIGQGESSHYYIQVEPGTSQLSVDLALETLAPQNEYEHTIALGRCAVALYSPDGSLYKSTPYIGASYGDILTTTAHLEAASPKAGLWQLTITSSDWLSMYNHFETKAKLSVTLAAQ